MLIDWFTVGAQTLNFLILVWLLKRFLYRPILNAIDAREQRIASELASAREKSIEAQQAEDLFRQKNQLIEQQRNKLLQAAAEAANAERLRLLEVARREAEELTSKHQIELQREQQKLAKEISTCTCQEVLAITRQALTDLAGLALEVRITEKLLEQLQQPDAKTHRVLCSVPTTADPIKVQSASPLTNAQQTALQKALEQCAGTTSPPVLFSTSPELISGIELSVGSYKLGWNITEYLRTFENRLDEFFATTTQSIPSLTGNAIEKLHR